MYATERQFQIERELDTHGRVSVVALAALFDVTTETVRRDLAALEQSGRLRRVHGGAVARDRMSTMETTVAERRTRDGGAKAAIAQRALTVLTAGFEGSLYIDAGTTTAAVAAQLPARLSEIAGRADVITNAVGLAANLTEAEDLTLTVIGGRVRPVTGAAVGANTVQAISQLRPDIAFVGTNGLSASFGASTPDIEEAAVKSAVVRAAQRVVLVCDASKLGRESLRSFAALDALDVLVTDVDPAPELARALADADVEIWRS